MKFSTCAKPPRRNRRKSWGEQRAPILPLFYHTSHSTVLFARYRFIVRLRTFSSDCTMGPSALTLIRAAFLDRSEVSLGCLVPNLLEPGQDFHPVKPPVITPEQINTRYIENIHDFLGAGKHIGLRTKLASAKRQNPGQSRPFWSRSGRDLVLSD
jgi:hypothetical protein